MVSEMTVIARTTRD